VTDTAPLKVLIASHSHPRFSNGGAEIAGYQLFTDLKSRPNCQVWFLGCIRNPKHQRSGATFSQPFGPEEFFYTPGGFDWFKFSNLDPNFPGEFRRLLGELRPQVVHFTHYIVLGLEALLHVRRALPQARIVVTLHEFLAICNHFGQMVTREDHALCHRASQVRCSACFPDRDPADFYLRERYIKRFFDLVDHFIAPSEFLADRYIAWGLPARKVSVIENLLPLPRLTARTGAAREPGPLRVGFFGQISFLKGIDVLFDAAHILEDTQQWGVSIEIFGDYRGQPPQFQSQFLERVTKVGRNVSVRGPYEPERVDELMRQVDLVVTPSIWWENSPLVIQEALRNRRPVVCSDIGGMAEKVRDGQDGFHFPVGNAVALASLLTRIAADRDALGRVSATLRAAPDLDMLAAQHRAVYAPTPAPAS
jgi:glycosyltransferase involved in cell wall biosynthesis